MFEKLDLNKETINLYKECFDTNGSSKRKENIEWQFFNNICKPPLVSILYDSVRKKTAGIYAASCQKFYINGNEFIGIQSLDTITDKDYRGKGIFTNLATGIYKEASDKSVALVYGFPNGNSIYGFKNKLEWQVLDPLPFLIKPLQSKYFTNKIKFLKFLPNIKLSFKKFKKKEKFELVKNNDFPIEVNELWISFSKKIGISISRDIEYLKWRFVDKPNENYNIIHCYSSNQNQYLGFIVFAIKQKHGGKIGYIMELMYDIDNKEVGNYLLSYAVDHMINENVDAVLAWNFKHSPTYSVFKSLFFYFMPDRIRPIELHFGVRSFNRDNSKFIYNRNNWYISYADSDTV